MNKRPHLALETPDTTESSSADSNPDTPPSSLEDEDDEDVDVASNQQQQQQLQQQQEIQVEFEARTPEECDYHGIKRLLQKLFSRPSSVQVDLPALAQFVIGQRNVGSVITQSRNQDDDDDDDIDDEDQENGGNGEDFEDLNNEVFGVTTILKLSVDQQQQQQQQQQLAKQVRAYLVDIAKKEEVNLSKLTSLLGDKSRCLGFVISERIMNIPPQISRPLYETLFNEIRKAKAKRLPFDFTHFVLLARCLKAADGGLHYVNAEEEMLEEESVAVVETAPGIDPNPNPNPVVDLNESEYENTSKILILDAAKCDRYLTLLNQLFPI